jgi:hypothetical protein
MAEFRTGETQVTRESQIKVDAGLKPGRHLFRLVVVNDRGEESLPSDRVVTIVERR